MATLLSSLNAYRLQGSKIVLVRSYLRVSQAAGQVNILIFLLKIKFSPCMPINFVMQGKCLFSDISRPAGWSDLKLYDASNWKTYLYLRNLGPDAVSVVGPTGATLLDFFYSSNEYAVCTIESISLFYRLLYLDYTVPRRCFFCGSFMLFLSCFVMLSCTSVY